MHNLGPENFGLCHRQTEVNKKKRTNWIKTFNVIVNLKYQILLGHNRTGSELSAAGSEESSNGNGASNHEVERLLKKISDLNEVLEIRESKLVELSRSNLEFQEKNTDLNRCLIKRKKVTFLTLLSIIFICF